MRRVLTAPIVLAIVSFVACGDDDVRAQLDGTDTGVPANDGGPHPDARTDGASDDARADTPDGDPDGAVQDAASDAGILPPACDPRSPTACPESERCALVTEFARRGVAFFTCRVDPGVAEGQVCDLSGATGSTRRALVRDDCASGTACTFADGVTGSGLACRRVCIASSDCGLDEVCEVLLPAAISADPFPRAGTCRREAGCDPVEGTGCDAGLTCTLVATTEGALATSCRDPGDHTEHEGCLERECAAGLTCLPPLDADGSVGFTSDDTRCLRACDPTRTETGCAAGESCVARDGATHGVCVAAEPDPVGDGERSARVIVPPAHDGVTRLPLLLALHGNPGDSTRVDGTFRISRAARTHGFYAVLADGTRDSVGSRFWNATPACCDFDRSEPDDSTYLHGLVEAMQARYPIDTARVWIFGTSNGGFMAHRLACDHADTFTAIVSRAGSTFDDAADCAATMPVSALEIHGERDANVPYEGGSFPGGSYPGAIETVERWATVAGCDLAGATDGDAFDLDLAIDGDETVPRTWSFGCAPGVEAALWTLRGSTHFVELAPDGTDRIVAWLAAHPR